MNTNIIILITIASCFVAFCLIRLGVVVLTKQKVDGVAALDDVYKGIGYAQSIAAAVKPFLPGVAGTVIETTLKYAGQAVSRVESSYKTALQSGDAVNDTRKLEASTMIKTALALEGISMTADTQKLINTVIPLIVLALPKTHEDTLKASQVPELVPEDTTGTCVYQNIAATITAQ